MNEVVEPESIKPEKTTTADTAKIVYILYMVGIVFGITGLVGVVMAYINKTDAPEWLKSHYQFQIRTFWIGGLYLVIGSLLLVVLIGWFILLFWVLWLIIRCVKGMKSLEAKEAHPNPTGWFFN
ncbi:DUF4870 family protein [Colwellia echini]|uniref:DUF4870 domain-containing protein n=1 Tax=Colwellia echini TaxID=1982103 RepID=A0ABY3N207_9GAMM|nr:hypothetical protein [Colwellia echini]TYK67267.1 hypothetical protein CWS31_001725 [Colwellia echini]